ncbi:dTDP-glucose 4,6-dehydratase [Agrilactobacillus fermenti]|uniref:dTDP-glucose 4,6-dehydratase n=1 Tax=Agrilactobacillus fermenti TaxID=2586909 RepID=UPI003A5BB418
MRLLVTGGSGFIGSNFIHCLLQRHPDNFIVNLDKITYAANPNSLADVASQANYRFVQGDILNTALVTYVMQQYKLEAIINFAAESHVDRSITDPDIFVQTNVLGTQHLLDVALKMKVNRFLQVSTDEVYGELGETGQFTESSPLQPHSPYSAAKAAADLLVQAYHRTYQLPTNITRCSNNYGPYQHPEKLIPKFVTHALTKQPLPLYGNGINVRDWIHVQDHCRALYLVLTRGKIGETYNIGSHHELTNQKIAELIIRELGLNLNLIKYVADRPGHDQRYAMDPTKIEHELGWRPRVDFKQGLKQTIAWYQNHSEWWQYFAKA